MDKLAMLQNLGLDAFESRVYLALLSLKKAPAGAIAKLANTKRPTTYLALKSLKNKKLVSLTNFRGVKDYKIESVYSLKKYITKQRQIMNLEITKLNRKYKNRKVKLPLRVYTNITALKTLLEKSLRQKSQLHIIGNQKLFSDHLCLFWDYFLKRSQQNSQLPNFKNSIHPVNLLIWKDKVVFVTFDNFQLFGFKNPSVAQLYKEIWKNYSNN